MRIDKLQYVTQGTSYLEIIQEVVSTLDSGVEWIQLRVKNPSANFEEVAQDVAEVCKNKATLIINDRVDIAYTVGADGVHLGKDDMRPNKARELLGSRKIIGYTANSIEEIRLMEGQVNYIALGQFYNETSGVIDVEKYESILAEKYSQPVVAFGDFDFQEAEKLNSIDGLHGLAVSSHLKNSRNKARDAKELLALFAKTPQLQQ